MNEEWKNRLESLLSTARLAFHWGYIPFIIYLGKYRRAYIKPNFSICLIFNLKFIIKGFKRGADPGLPPLHPLQ